MQVYEELVARGLIAQVTDEDEIREMVNAGKATLPRQKAGPDVRQTTRTAPIAASPA